MTRGAAQRRRWAFFNSLLEFNSRMLCLIPQKKPLSADAADQGLFYNATSG